MDQKDFRRLAASIQKRYNDGEISPGTAESLIMDLNRKAAAEGLLFKAALSVTVNPVEPERPAVGSYGDDSSYDDDSYG